MSKYSIIEVKTAKQEQEFLDFLNNLYKGDKNWIRPLDNDIKSVFDPKKNHLFENGEAIRWMLLDETGTTVGRIAAFYNRELAASNEQPTGGCGFFDCINNQQAANQLFDAAKTWLAERGMEAMDGSVNFGDRDSWWGVLVDGFYPPVYGMNYNPPYYKELFESYGFQNYFNQHTYRKDFSSPSLNPVVIDKAQRLYNTPGYRFSNIDTKNLSQHAEEFRTIYNKAWAKFTGVPEISSEHAQALMRKMKPIADGRIMNFAYYNEEPIGFFIMVPDLNHGIKGLNGKFGWWSKLRFMYRMKICKKGMTINGLIFGVIPEFQGKGIECGMIEYFRHTIEKIPYYDHLQLNWVGDFNPLMMRMSEQYVCAHKYKQHTTYRYLFDREKPFKRAPRVSASSKLDKTRPAAE